MVNSQCCKILKSSMKTIEMATKKKFVKQVGSSTCFLSELSEIVKEY